MPSSPGENRGKCFKIEFSPAQEFSQTVPRFSTGCKGTKNIFYFFYKIIIFCLNKEKDN